MKVTIHLEGKDRAELFKQYQAHAALLSDGVQETTPTKTKKAAKVEAQEDFDLDSSANETDDIEDVEETETDAPEHTLKDVQAACAKFAKKQGGKEKIARILKKYGAKKLQDLEPENYTDVIELLN